MTPIAKGNSLILWGTVAFDATFRQMTSGKEVSNFIVNYGRQKGADGRNSFLSMHCTAWNDVAKYASGLEKGDSVFVCGELVKDDYRSNKSGKDEFLLNVGYMAVMPVVDEAVTDNEPEPEEEIVPDEPNADGSDYHVEDTFYDDTSTEELPFEI